VTPPSNEWRNWLYAILLPLGGVASGAILIWLISILSGAWPSGTELARIGVLGNVAYGMVGLMALVSLGLTIRNAIRNLKLKGPGGTEIDATGRDEQG